ncbi:uncharacterized protein LOC122945640 isoform X2 [Bufo gargarizans]|uniref:uncharacterized protein LOC122945640 isoform X2 n=1 Tax=Bufo gargarizans TaxID=30331 RepID=UPI001CF246D4|nr:uncharacterized protein LOC122945640 isoform X2 [Bufo gargarizans]
MGNDPSRGLKIYRRIKKRPMTELGDSSCEAGRSCETVYSVCYRRDGSIRIVFYRYPLKVQRDFTQSIKEDGLIRILLRRHPLRVLQDFIQRIKQDKPPKTDGPERPSFYKNKFMKDLKSIFCCYNRSYDKKGEKDSEYLIIKKIPVGVGANIDFPDILDKLPIQETSPDPLDIIYDNCPVEDEPKQFTMFVKYMGDRTIVIKDKPPKTDGPERPLFYKNKFMKDILDKLPIQETSPDPLDIIYDNCPVEDEPKQFTMFVKYMGDRTIVIKDKPPKTDGPERPSLYKNKFMKDEIKEKNPEYLIIKKIPVGVGANIDFPDELLSVPIQETG